MGIEALKSLWKSWSLLLGGTLTVSIIWLAPSNWIPDVEVTNLRDQYRGYIGSLAVVLITLTASRILISWGDFALRWFRELPERRVTKERQQVQRDRVLRRIVRLEEDTRTLLRKLVETNQSQITLETGDPRADRLWRSGLFEIVHADIGDPNHSWRVTPWVWQHLRRNRSLLSGTDDVRRT